MDIHTYGVMLHHCHRGGRRLWHQHIGACSASYHQWHTLSWATRFGEQLMSFFLTISASVTSDFMALYKCCYYYYLLLLLRKWLTCKTRRSVFHMTMNAIPTSRRWEDASRLSFLWIRHCRTAWRESISHATVDGSGQICALHSLILKIYLHSACIWSQVRMKRSLYQCVLLELWNDRSAFRVMGRWTWCPVAMWLDNACQFVFALLLRLLFDVDCIYGVLSAYCQRAGWFENQPASVCLKTRNGFVRFSLQCCIRAFFLRIFFA